MTTTIRRSRIARRSRALMAGAATVALAFAAACGNSDDGGETGDGGDDPVVEEPAGDEYEHPQVVADLQGARQVVLDGLDEFGQDQTQFFLADDVSAPEQNYGMWVLPIERSEETEYITQQVSVSNGNFLIDGISAEDGTIYTIDQDGEVTVGE